MKTENGKLTEQKKLSAVSNQQSADSLRQLTESGGAERSRGVSTSGEKAGEKYVPKLTVRTKSDANSVTIEIQNNGPGIPDEIKDKIMQPFFTTKKGTAGTGLGLSITNDIVKAHGGNITIHSSEKGTSFNIYIPSS